MKTSDKGIALIKKFEGLELKAYRDAIGVLTIGYGHTGGVKDGQTITEAQAVALLRDDLAGFERAIERMIDVSLSQQQFDALVSFTFNVGSGALNKSTLRRKLNQGDYQGAAEEFLRWAKAGGKELPGLVKRRAAERELFLS